MRNKQLIKTYVIIIGIIIGFILATAYILDTIVFGSVHEAHQAIVFLFSFIFAGIISSKKRNTSLHFGDFFKVFALFLVIDVAIRLILNDIYLSYIGYIVVTGVYLVFIVSYLIVKKKQRVQI